MTNETKILDGEKGYCIDTMSASELTTIKGLITDQYLARIGSLFKSDVNEFFLKGMNQYHLLSQMVEHQNLWPKKARILGPNAVEQFKNLSFFKRLKSNFNVHSITNEDGSEWEEVYWRIVRPGSSDVGDFHADKWFWDLGHGKIPEGYKRIKIWIAIEVVKGKSGLAVIPGSHLKQDWSYHGKEDHTGISKPKFDEDITKLNVINLSTEPGDYVIFNDQLIHAGMPNQSDETRVSLEATLLIPNL